MGLINLFKNIFTGWADYLRERTIGMPPPAKVSAATSGAIIEDTLLANTRTTELQGPIALQTSPSSEFPAETTRALVSDDLLTNIHPTELQEPTTLQASPSGNVLASRSVVIHNNLSKDGETQEFKRPISFESSQFQKLPAELLRHIRDYLDAPSAAMFSVCSMQMYTLIGMCPPKSYQDKVLVGDLLARDLLDKIACSVCLEFHEIQDAKNYIASSNYDIPCVRDCFEGTNPSHSLIGEDFSSVLFKMAMKRHHQNRDDATLLELMSPKKDICRIAGYPRISETTCRIVEGSLMQRLQTVLVSSQAEIWSISLTKDPQLEICPHIVAEQSRAGLRIIEVNPADRDNSQTWLRWCFGSCICGSGGTGLKSCKICKTDYRFDLKYCPRVGQALFFTRWKDLGGGPDTEDYLRHIKEEEEAFPTISDPRSGEVAAKFEGSARYEFDSLMTAEKGAKLCKAWRDSLLLEKQQKFAKWGKHYRFMY